MAPNHPNDRYQTQPIKFISLPVIDCTFDTDLRDYTEIIAAGKCYQSRTPLSQ